MDLTEAFRAHGGTGLCGARQPRDGTKNTTKNELKAWLKQCWCIPPEASAACVWRMEDVLEVYTRPYDPRFPQVCLDESAKQLLKDKRESLPMQPGQPERVDDTVESAGMCKMFLAGEPLAGKRFVKADFTPDERGLGSLHS